MNPDLSVSTVYEFFAEHGGPSTKKVTGEICVHDPCVTRNSNGLHEAVRLLIGGMGADLSELKNFREKSLCCGKGGGVEDFDQAGKIRKQAEFNLIQSEKKYQSLVETQTELVSCFTPEGEFTFVNQVFCDFFKKSRKICSIRGKSTARGFIIWRSRKWKNVTCKSSRWASKLSFHSCKWI